jgi:hypothetical protein
MKPRTQFRALAALAMVMLTLGLFLRVAALRWNTRLQGDVNLFALTARELRRHGDLSYPMKYEYTERTPYRSLTSPATQHPPLFPWLAGIAAIASHTDDTFSVLKAICFASGTLLLLLFAATGLKYYPEAFLALFLAATSPILVDFSANGSPYMLAAVLLYSVVLSVARFRYDLPRDYAVAGLLTGIGFITHGVLICVAAVFVVAGLARLSRLRPSGVAIFAGAALLPILPLLVWNLKHFGVPLYSSAPLYALSRLGLMKEAIADSAVTLITHDAPLSQVASAYGVRLVDSAHYLLARTREEVPLPAIILALLGFYSIARRNQRAAFALLGTGAMYALVVCAWATDQQRFLVPGVPLLFLAAGFGATELVHRSASILAGGLLAWAVIWNLLAIDEAPPTRYYENDATYAAQYASMRRVVSELSLRPPRPVLGYSTTLDGGAETVYWDGFPFIRGRGYQGLMEPAIVRKLVADFDVGYVWTDRSSVDLARRILPCARVIVENADYAVLQLHEGASPTEGQCSTLSALRSGSILGVHQAHRTPRSWCSLENLCGGGLSLDDIPVKPVDLASRPFGNSTETQDGDDRIDNLAASSRRTLAQPAAHRLERASRYPASDAPDCGQDSPGPGSSIESLVARHFLSHRTRPHHLANAVRQRCARGGIRFHRSPTGAPH